MKIAFDVSDLCTDRADGTTRYTKELAKWFPKLAPEHNWNYFAPCPEQATSYKLEAKSSNEWHSSPWPKYWTQTRFPVDLFRVRPDVLFMPIQQLPIIRPRNMKTVATVHDLAVHKYPEQFTYKDWLLLHVFSAQVSREADHIIADSKATADDIAHYYGRTKNVHIVYLGVSHDMFRPPVHEEAEELWSRIRDAYPQVQKPYVLYVGQIQPRKNIVRLIDAFEKVHERDPDLQLVIVGSHGWLQKPILKKIKTSSCAAHIHMLGRVSDELLVPLYWHAEVFALPSLYEGFGIPVLEAMAAGCPVVTSNVSSLPEVAGDAAVIVDPMDVSSIAEGLIRAREKRETLIPLGFKQAKKFTWEKTARDTLQIVHSV